MLGEEQVLLRTPLGDFVATRAPARPPSAPAREASARRALFHVRFELEAGKPSVVEAVQRLLDVPPSKGQGGNAEIALRELVRRLDEEVQNGRVLIEAVAEPASLTDERRPSLPDLPPLPPRRAEPTTHSFELRLVDEIGQAIAGVDADFSADGPHTLPTNAAGVALLEDVHSSSATAAFLDPKRLDVVLEPRWRKLRPGQPPKESNLQEVVFRGGALGPFPIKAEVANTIVVKPPLGKLFVELWDKTGRFRHSECPFEITGPMSFSGTTDANGRLLQESVLPGAYELELTVEHALGKDTYRLPLVVLEAEEVEPQVRMVGAVPASLLARIRGLLFDLNKTFILPTALDSLARIREVYEDNDPSDLLLVGHTDTSAGDAVNDPLSLDRAESVRAYLEDDVETWFANYSTSKPERSRWGATEDLMMIQAMPDFASKPDDEDPVVFFQRTRGLEQDGIAGPITRRKLIEEYMLLDGVSLSEGDFDIDPTTHGCGEHFPLDDTGEALDTAPEDDKRDQLDRRVELFFFDKEFGIFPKPPGKNSGKNSTQYPKWRAGARLELDAEIGPVQDFFVRIHVLPEEVVRFDERFRLFSDDGRFSQEKDIADAIPGDTFVDLLFTSVPIRGVYSMEVFRSKADPYLLFQDVPFAELDGHIEEEEVDEAEEDDLAPIAPDEAEEEALGG